MTKKKTEQTEGQAQQILHRKMLAENLRLFLEQKIASQVSIQALRVRLESGDAIDPKTVLFDLWGLHQQASRETKHVLSIKRIAETLKLG